MSDQPTVSTPLSEWSDPLSNPSDRFPLGPPHWHWEGSEDDPSDSPARPFSLRGLVKGPVPAIDMSQYGYCEELQIGVVHVQEGLRVPLLKHTAPGPTPITSGTPDGQGPSEEVSNQDWQND
jgi:hypothetical protein